MQLVCVPHSTCQLQPEELNAFFRSTSCHLASNRSRPKPDAALLHRWLSSARLHLHVRTVTHRLQSWKTLSWALQRRFLNRHLFSLTRKKCCCCNRMRHQPQTENFHIRETEFKETCDDGKRRWQETTSAISKSISSKSMGLILASLD